MNDNETKCSDNSSEKECNNNSNCKWNKNVCINKHFLVTNVGKIILIIIFMIMSVILIFITIYSTKYI